MGLRGMHTPPRLILTCFRTRPPREAVYSVLPHGRTLRRIRKRRERRRRERPARSRVWRCGTEAGGGMRRSRAGRFAEAKGARAGLPVGSGAPVVQPFNARAGRCVSWGGREGGGGWPAAGGRLRPARLDFGGRKGERSGPATRTEERKEGSARCARRSSCVRHGRGRNRGVRFVPGRNPLPCEVNMPVVTPHV
jgi:hypothetical protein